MSKVVMPLSVYDELQFSLAKAKEEAKEWKEKAAQNAKSLSIVVWADEESPKYEHVSPFLRQITKLPANLNLKEIIPSITLKEMMDSLKDIEVISLKAQIENLTQEKELLAEQLRRAENSRKECEKKYEVDTLNIAAKEAYKKLDEMKRSIRTMQKSLKNFRETTFMRAKVANKIEEIESWIIKILQ